MNRSGTKITKYGIEFDSLLELDLYEEFKNRGVRVERGVPITVLEGGKIWSKCYTNDNKAFKMKMENASMKDIKYTPDFVLTISRDAVNLAGEHCYYPDATVYVEAKGFANETFRYRWKLFKKWVDKNDMGAILFLVKRKHNGRVKPKDNEARIKETKEIVDSIINTVRYGKPI